MTSFQIEHQCPQCGAPANLEETDRLFACPFCRVKSFLLTRDYFRYVLPAKNASGKNLVYFPYWRFKGLLLFSLPAGNDHKFIDVNQRAADAPGMPLTLGLRAQTMKLKFAAPDMEGRFIPPARSFSEIFGAFQKRFSLALPKPLLYCAHLGESIGLLYSPFYAKGQLYDAVLDTPVGKLPEGFPGDSGKGGKTEWGVNFVPALCPDCGWDLEGCRDALVLHCRNCKTSWYPSNEKLTRVESFAFSDADQTAHHLPFWQITSTISEIALKTHADLVKVANLPMVVQKSFEDREFRFWVPAFKLRAQAFLRLAESLTLIQAQDMVEPSLPAGRHHPVTLAVEEACESLKVVLAGFLKPRRKVADLLSHISIHPTHFRLAYLPFLEDQHDLLQPQTQVAVNKNLLSLSSNL
jgi:DNA-directed RNA polymerase subunit RPC12/RpoP